MVATTGTVKCGLAAVVETVWMVVLVVVVVGAAVVLVKITNTDAAVCGMFLNEHVCSTVHRWHINVYYHWKSELRYQHYSTLNGLYDVCCTSWGHRQFQCSDV